MNEISNRYVASVAAPKMPTYQGWSPCIVWCERHLGDGWWFIGDGVFEFVNEQDHLMFMLRWS
jgi:hypothetical protein